MADRNASVASAAHNRKSVRDEPVTSVLPGGDVPYDPNHEYDADEEVLAALGYKPEFKREFSLFSTFCVSFAVLGLLPSFASTLFYGMGYAGTGGKQTFCLRVDYDMRFLTGERRCKTWLLTVSHIGMTWGWIVAMVGVQCVAMSMAELCSSMPTSGGLYYAAAVLAPPGWGPIAAWITGWSNWLVQITGAPSVNYATAAMMLAAGSIYNPDYTPTDWQTFLLAMFLMIIHAFMSSAPTKVIAQINTFGSVFNMIALVVVVIIIPAATNRESQGLPKFAPSAQVWGTIENGTDWPDGIAVLMSFIAVLWTMSGYDAPFHLAEECSNANIAAPRAIVLTSTLGGIFGWFLQLVVAYTVIDITEVIESDLGQPFAAFLNQTLERKTAMAVLALTIIAGFFMGQGCMIAASRVTFAYARDGCFPFSNLWSHVNTKTRTPVNAVFANATIGILLLLLIFAGEVTIGALFSVGAIAAEIAFCLPIFIRVFFVGNRFRPGPWNLGRFSIPIGATASAFVALMIPILNFPWARGSNLT
jgi:amino acid transporter